MDGKFKWQMVLLIVIFLTQCSLVESRRARGKRKHFRSSHGVSTTKKHDLSQRLHPGGGTYEDRNEIRHTSITNLYPRVFKNWWDSAFQSDGQIGFSHNPYIRIFASHNDLVWSREQGWHSRSDEDEYHTPDITDHDVEVDSTSESSSTSQLTVDESNPWKGSGSFTGDIKLHCLKPKSFGCAVGVVQVYHKELGQWGTICGDRWTRDNANVVCQYLNFGRGGKPMKVSSRKVPKDIADLPEFLKNLDCEGDEWALTDCAGDRLKKNHTCKTPKLAGVKCLGRPEEESTDPEDVTCHRSKTKCQEGTRCLDPDYICDGMADCPWGSDEVGCTGDSCKKSEYWCGPKGGGCISNSYICDGEEDCIDGSDERECEQFLNLFRKTNGSRMKTKKSEVEWQPINPHVCAQKCKEETSFVCTSFDYFKKTELCLLYSPRSPTQQMASAKWDHYDRLGVETCTGDTKYLCEDGTCIQSSEVCDFKRDCPNGEDENECEPMKLRLRGGSGSYEGRVEAAKGKKFGLICDTHWTIQEANVVCRQLNFSRGAEQALTGGAFPRNTDRLYVLDNVRCQGDERSLEECHHSGWNKAKCQLDHEVGVVCKTKSTPSPETPVTIKPTQMVLPTSTAPTCGIKPPNVELAPVARIVGGSPVQPNQWPWQVGIWLPWTYWCGGSLIHPCWVLTAAHCFMRNYKLSDYTIRLGDHLTEQDENTEQYMKIARLIKHDYNLTSKENDIALLQIQSESGECARITPEVQTICLPSSRKQFKPRKECTITGWGKLSSTDMRPYTYQLQEADIPLISPKKCAAQSEYGMLPESMFCAGFMAGGVDSCQGDSGGPLSCQDEDNRYYVWGIVSWGHGCAKPKAPGVYANVALYLDWIEENTGLDL